MILKVTNNLDKSSQFSFIASPISAGGTTVPWRNANPFSASQAVQVGKTNDELSEVILLGTAVPAGTIGTITGNLRFDHPADTPLYAITYDKIIFKRSTSGTTGTASAIATVSITPDSPSTEYNDTSGAVGYAYKTQYYNSVTAGTSAESDWFVPGGPSFYSLAGMRSRIKNRLFATGFIQNDQQIDTWINEWYETMTNAAIKVNQDYLLGTAIISVGTSGYGTITQVDFKQARKVEISYEGGNGWYLSTKMFINQFDDRTLFAQTAPIHFFRGDNVIGISPSQTNTQVRITYYKLNTVLVNETDELPLSMRGYSNSFVDYGLAAAYQLDSQDNNADRYFARANASKQDFISEITPRDQTGPTYINFDSEITPSNYFYDWDYLP